MLVMGPAYSLQAHFVSAFSVAAYAHLQVCEDMPVNM